MGMQKKRKNNKNDSVPVLLKSKSGKKDKIEKLKAYKKSVIFEYVTGKKQVLLLHNEYNNQDNKMY